MTQKDKALELYNKYEQLGRDFTRGVSMKEFAKQCALIAVDEVIEFMEADDFDSDTCYWANHSQMKYWVEVKQEIEAL
jgi:hypothetical protein